jgi:hypothetical protein
VLDDLVEVAWPSSLPSVNANPLLVVASALKPSASSARADPASQGLGMTNVSPSWRSRNAAAFSCWEGGMAGKPCTMALHAIGMLLLHGGTARDLQAREQLAAALPDGSEVGEPDGLGVFEVVVEADDSEHALTTVWNAVAASGTDDHLLFLEHPELPEHWRVRSSRPATA